MNKCRMQTAALMAMAVLMTCSLSSGHESHLHAPLARSSAQGSALDDDQRAYYLDLFSHAAVECALPDWEQLKEAVVLLQFNQLDMASAASLYDSIKQSLPSVCLTWDGVVADLSSFDQIEIAEGIPRCVFIEVDNQSGTTEFLSAAFAGSSASNVAWTPSGEIAGMIARLAVDDRSETGVALTVVSASGGSTVVVPLTVVQPATIRGVVREHGSGQPFPARVFVQGGDSEFRHAEEFASNSTLSYKRVPGVMDAFYKLPFFYSSGSFVIRVPPGTVRVTAERGPEHVPETAVFTLQPGESRSVDLEPARFIDLAGLGWVSGDTHVHWVKNWWFENEDLHLLSIVQRAEDLRVVNNLTLRHADPHSGADWVVPDQAWMGPVPGYDTGPYLIQMAEEYRNDPFYGHLNFLNLAAPTLLGLKSGPTHGLVGVSPLDGLVWPISTGDLLGALAEDYPINATAIDAALTHQPAESRPIIVASHGIPGEVPADIALGRIDSIDQVAPAEYYKLLDCGIRIPLTDGADHPVRLVGQTRCYVKVQEPQSYGSWIDGILRGATFVTSGPMLFLTLDGVEPGSELATNLGSPVVIRAEAHSSEPIGRLQIVSNNEILFDQVFASNTATVNLVHTADVSRWFVARCSTSSNPSYHAVNEANAAHTSAVYLKVDGKEIFVDSGAAQDLMDRCQAGGDDVYLNGLFFGPHAASKRNEARDYFYQGRDAYGSILSDNR